MRTSVIFGYAFIALFGLILVMTIVDKTTTKDQFFNAAGLALVCYYIGLTSLLYAKRKYGVATLS